MNFEQFLEDKFSEFDEIGGMPIIEDNCEDMFENWSSGLDVQELIEYADEFADEVREEMKKEMQDLMDLKLAEQKESLTK